MLNVSLLLLNLYTSEMFYLSNGLFSFSGCSQRIHFPSDKGRSQSRKSNWTFFTISLHWISSRLSHITGTQHWSRYWGPSCSRAPSHVSCCRNKRTSRRDWGLTLSWGGGGGVVWRTGNSLEARTTSLSWGRESWQRRRRRPAPLVGFWWYNWKRDKRPYCIRALLKRNINMSPLI